MNDRKLMIAGVAVSLLSLFSCGGNGSVNEGDGGMPVVEFEGYKYDCIAQVADSDAVDTEGGAYWRLSGSGVLPVKIGDKDITQLHDSLERLGSVMLVDDAYSAPRLGEGMTLTELSPDSVKACSTEINQLSVSLVTPEVIVWKSYVYSYLCLAAHGFYNTTYVNYGVSDGKILSISDLMNPGYESRLAELIREKLKENDVSLIVPLEEVGIPNDFELTTQGIRFLFGLYEIAAYVEGEIVVELYGYELEDLLAPGVGSKYFSMQ